MNRKTVIITIEPGRKFKAWGNLRKLCKKRGWVYNTVIKKQLPVTIDSIEVNRVKYEQ